ncbi:MAG: tetratricopeptide repeat protein [Gammaproteobacteria bacterium]|nr:tetratricopeptide repeat protein [Gammaproteobacteria bacterium]
MAAMPEPDFNQLRQTVFSAARQDFQLGIQRIDDILQQQEQQLTLEQQIRLLYSKADYLHRSNHTNQAIEILAMTKALSLESADPSILYSYHNLTAGIFSDLGLFQPAVQHYRQALEKAQFLSNGYYIKQTENNMALILTKQHQYDEAKRYFKQFQQYGIQTDDASVQAVALNNLGEVAMDEGDTALAATYHRQALALRTKHQLTHHFSYSMLNLAKVAKAEQNWPEVITLAQQCLTLRRDRNDLELIEPGLLLAEAFSKTNQHDAAQQQLEQTLAIAKRLQNAEWLLQAWLLQAELYRSKNPDMALQAMRQALLAQQQLSGQRFDISLAQSTADLGLKSREIQLQESKRQHELSELAASAQQQKLWLAIGATSLVLLLVLAFSLNIRRKNQALAQSLDHLQRTRRQLVEAEKMASLTSLVTGIAHQLNTPLGTVLTAVSCGNEQLTSLQRKLQEKTLTAADLRQGLQDNSELLQLAEQSTHRAAELVQRFKLISAQFDQSAPEPVALHQYLPTLMHSLLLSLNADKSTALQLNGPELNIISYPALLTKVFSALTENALVHGLGDQSHPKISIDWQLQERQLQLKFADNGSGIAKDLASKVFDPFFSTKLGQGSLGLGLNIVFNTLQTLKGHIELADPTQQPPGSCFVLTLPLDIREATSEPQSQN